MKKSLALIAIGSVLACSSGETSSGTGGKSSTTGAIASSTTNASTTSTESSSSTSTVSSSTSTATVSSSASSGTGGASDALITLPVTAAPYGLTADDAHLYWTNSGSGEVMQANVDGTSQIVLQSGEDFPIAVHVAAGSVYWVSYSLDGMIRSVPVGGGSVNSIFQAPAALDLAIGDTYIWWTREPDDVQRVPIAGLPMGVIDADLLTGNPLSIGIAADASNIYWVNRQDGGVKRADPDLSNQTLLAIGDVSWGVAIDDTNIYWTESGSGSQVGKVMQASKIDGSNPIEIANNLGRPKGIAVDATTIYWVDSADGMVEKAPIGGGASTTLASGETEPISIAINSTHVFWTDRAGNHIGAALK